MDGVVEAESGYAGGHTPDPTYRTVCDGGTGHAEVVRVQFDPSMVTYETLLKQFFSIHDASFSRGASSQYRSIILTTTDEQAQQAQAYLDSINATRNANRQIATQLSPAGEFYRAEEYHQRYYEKMGVSSCRIK
ncbi:MAG: peptide-methionine (S)-S-oxide reductase MsrA [Fimbriimonadaceae bacterium]|nr:peptide-methionine (S)-S-oxide reductase MsrA [Fimbriimonadaceae bacterium]